MASSVDRLDLVFSALSDRTRRKLVARLADGEASISELAAPFDMTLVAVSKHVRVLERAGLVKRTIDGRVHRCTLSAHRMREANAWLERYRVFWDDTLARLAAYVEDGDG